MLKIIITITMIVGLSACGHEADQASNLQSDQILILLAPLNATQIDDAADPGCLRGVQARFQSKVDGTLADVGLENTVSGPCEILMPKEARSFPLVRLADDCGSKVYRSKSGGREILVFDHSSRICEDFRANLIEIKETDSDARNRIYGGNWN